MSGGEKACAGKCWYKRVHGFHGEKEEGDESMIALHFVIGVSYSCSYSYLLLVDRYVL